MPNAIRFSVSIALSPLVRVGEGLHILYSSPAVMRRKRFTET